MSTFSPNLNIEEVARNADVGTWDTPTNSNWSIMDSAVGNIATIGLNNSNVILSAAQFQSKTIVFNSTLTGSVTITFPTSFTKSYEIYNSCTGSSAFTVTLATTAGGQVICAPPGEIVDCLNDGASLRFKNLGRIGSYMDWAGGSNVPTWVSGCTVPPYLDCNGQSFSSATYPVLAVVLGQTTVPDFRGRTAHYLNEGTGRLTSAGAGINGDASFATGGGNGVTLVAGQIPTLNSQAANNISVSIVGGGLNNGSLAAVLPGFSISGYDLPGAAGVTGSFVPQAASGGWGAVSALTGSNNISVNTQGTGSGTPVGATAPGAVAGYRLIRAG